MRAQIVMATHNPRQDLFVRQLRSIQNQSVQDWECLVFDDASTDRQAVAGLLASDPRFRLLPARPHMGTYLAFQHLLSQSEADVPLFLCDQDDAWHPEKLSRMLDLEHTTFSRMRVVDETGRLLKQSFLPRRPRPHALTPVGILLMNAVSGASMMLTMPVRQMALPFPAPQLRGWHDQWLAAVAARIDVLAYLDEPLVDYTRHAGQVVGDGLRRITASRIRTYGQRLRASGVRADLHSRAEWVTAAATRLRDLPGPDDPELNRLASGHFAQLLLEGLVSGDVPWSRALLLGAGAAV